MSEDDLKAIEAQCDVSGPQSITGGATVPETRALVAEVRRLRAAIRAELPVIGERSEEQSYGHFYGGDPRDFRPDEECSTEAEREAHRLACEAAERDEDDARRLPSAHQMVKPDEARDLVKSGEAVSAMIGPAGAHVHRAMFGLGVTTFRDEELGGVFDRLAAAIDAPGATHSVTKASLREVS